MQIRAPELEASLARRLLPAYVIHGDEPLLALEAADAVRAAARRAGFAERQVLEYARGFDWSEFTHACASLSLFAEKKIVELRLPGGKPGAQGGEAIRAYAEQASPEVLLLVTLPRLDRAGQNSAWFLALGAAGAIVEVWPLERARLPAWIGERLARQKQRAPQEVLEFLIARVEGNLLAAHQEIQKLALLAPEGELSLETVQQAVASVARYDPADAAESLLAGNLERYARVLDGLRGEGEAPTYVLYTVGNALFSTQAIQRGVSADAAFSQHRLFHKPLQRAVQAGARRLAPDIVDAAILDAAALDRTIKGVGEGDGWQAFLRLGLKLADGSKG